MVLSLIVVVVSWQLIYLLSDFLSKTSGLSETNTRKETIFVPLAYTLTVILTQGKFYCWLLSLYPGIECHLSFTMTLGNDTRWRGLGIRLIAGVWCLAASVLVPAYSGTLTSFLTTPIQRPIIESHLDIAGKISSAGIQVAVERGLGVDTQMQFWVRLLF